MRLAHLIENEGFAECWLKSAQGVLVTQRAELYQNEFVEHSPPIQIGISLNIFPLFHLRNSFDRRWESIPPDNPQHRDKCVII